MVSATEQRRFSGVVLVVLLLDIATKIAAEIWLRRYVGVPVIGDFFQLRLVYNPGAAFGIHVGEHSRWVFMALSIAALFVLGSMLRTTQTGDRIAWTSSGVAAVTLSENTLETALTIDR